MAPWRAAIYADHYAAECVLVGGARRAARMATKTWSDPTIFDFIELKRGGFLRSSNNSVTIDEEFRERSSRVAAKVKHVDERFKISAARKLKKKGEIDASDEHAFRVLFALAQAAYFDGTGEPGIISVDKLTQKGSITDPENDYRDGLFAGSAKYQIERLSPEDPEHFRRGGKSATQDLMETLARIVGNRVYQMLVNPCGVCTTCLRNGKVSPLGSSDHGS